MPYILVFTVNRGRIAGRASKAKVEDFLQSSPNFPFFRRRPRFDKSLSGKPDTQNNIAQRRPPDGVLTKRT